MRLLISFQQRNLNGLSKQLHQCGHHSNDRADAIQEPATTNRYLPVLRDKYCRTPNYCEKTDLTRHWATPYLLGTTKGQLLECFFAS